MTLDLTDDETQVLVQHLKHAIDNDPYPLSPRLLRQKAILAKLRPEPIHEPWPPPKVYAPPPAARGPRPAARGQKAAGPADGRDGYAATGAGDCAEIAAKKEGHPSAISGLAT
jgi:hypothetical protein